MGKLTTRSTQVGLSIIRLLSLMAPRSLVRPIMPSLVLSELERTTPTIIKVIRVVPQKIRREDDLLPISKPG
jgi:hypothetical protein